MSSRAARRKRRAGDPTDAEMAWFRRRVAATMADPGEQSATAAFIDSLTGMPPGESVLVASANPFRASGRAAAVKRARPDLRVISVVDENLGCDDPACRNCKPHLQPIAAVGSSVFAPVN